MSEQENTRAGAEKVICVRALLKKDQVDAVRNWFHTLQHRKYEVLETFREEGVWVESVFLEKAGEDDYLIYYLRADDVQQAMAIFQKSSHPIDLFHKDCWKKYIEMATVLEPVFDLQREHSSAGQIKPEHVLVDVIALGKKRCAFPIQGVLAYATEENFLGRVVDGYLPGASEVCLLSRKAAEQLCGIALATPWIYR